MRFYVLQNTVIGSRRMVGITGPEQARIGLAGKRRLYYDTFMDINSRFDLKLWFSDVKSRQSEDPEFCTLHIWRGDVMLTPPLEGKPAAILVVVDKALEHVISSFELPAHRFYPVTVENIDTGEKREYVVLQITYDKYKEIYYPEVTFVKTIDDNEIETIGTGIIKNFEEFINLRDEVQNEDSRATIVAKNILFRRSFDVVWGDAGEILFSERLKDAIGKIGMKETFFREYKYDIGFKQLY